MRVLNAQLISRLGFVANEITSKKQEVLDAIAARAEEIGDESTCVSDSVLALENAANYAGASLNGLIEEVQYYVDEVEKDYFYPLMRILQWESNIIQWSVKAALHRENPVTQTDRLLQRLEDDYSVVVALYQASINNIAREVNLFDDKMNEVKQTMFPQLNSIRDYFAFSATFIKENLSACEA